MLVKSAEIGAYINARAKLGKYFYIYNDIYNIYGNDEVLYIVAYLCHSYFLPHDPAKRKSKINKLKLLGHGAKTHKLARGRGAKFNK
jgi:hypothetical protein